MAFSEPNRRAQGLLAGKPFVAFRPLHFLPEALIPWGAAIAVGVALGGYTVAATFLPERWALLSRLVIVGALALLIVGRLRPVLLTAMLLDIPLQLDINMGFVDRYKDVTIINGYSVSVTTGVLVILYAVLLAELVTKRRTIPVYRLKPALPLFIYIVLAALSIVGASDPLFSRMELFLLVQVFLVFLYIVATVQSEKEITLITAVMLAGLILESLLMFWVRIRGTDYVLPIARVRIDDNMRVGGSVGSPNVAGAYLAMALAIALGVFFADTKGWLKKLSLVALGLGLGALALTGSRGAFIGLSVGLVAVYVLLWDRIKRSSLALLLVPAAMLLVPILFRDTLLVRFLEDTDGSAASRWPLIQLAFRMVIRNPILGIGLNNFVFAAPDYLTFRLSQAWFSVVHNKYLLIWSEIGTPGFIAFVWFLLSTLLAGLRVRKVGHWSLSPLATGYTAAIFAAMVHMLVEIYHGRAQTQMLWVMAAIVYAMQSVLIAEGDISESGKVVSQVSTAQEHE